MPENLGFKQWCACVGCWLCKLCLCQRYVALTPFGVGGSKQEIRYSKLLSCVHMHMCVPVCGMHYFVCGTGIARINTVKAAVILVSRHQSVDTQTPAPWPSPGCAWLVSLVISECPTEKSSVLIAVLNLSSQTSSPSDWNEALIKI